MRRKKKQTKSQTKYERRGVLHGGSDWWNEREEKEREGGWKKGARRRSCTITLRSVKYVPFERERKRRRDKNHQRMKKDVRGGWRDLQGRILQDKVGIIWRWVRWHENEDRPSNIGSFAKWTRGMSSSRGPSKCPDPVDVKQAADVKWRRGGGGGGEGDMRGQPIKKDSRSLFLFLRG